MHGGSEAVGGGDAGADVLRVQGIEHIREIAGWLADAVAQAGDLEIGFGESGEKRPVDDVDVLRSEHVHAVAHDVGVGAGDDGGFCDERVAVESGGTFECMAQRLVVFVPEFAQHEIYCALHRCAPEGGEIEQGVVLVKKHAADHFCSSSRKCALVQAILPA